MGATVTTVIGSDLVVQAGLRWRKLTSAQVAGWTEIATDSKAGGAAAAVGKAVFNADPDLASPSPKIETGARVVLVRPGHPSRFPLNPSD